MNPDSFTLELEALGDEDLAWSTYRQRVDQVCARFADRLDATVIAERAAFYLTHNALAWDEPAGVVLPLLEVHLGFALSTLRQLQVIVEAVLWSRRVHHAAEGFEAECRARLTALAAAVDHADHFQAKNILSRLDDAEAVSRARR